MTPKEAAQILGITDLPFEDWRNKGEEFSFLQVRRRARYYCGALRRKANGEDNKVRVPKKLVEYFEAQPQFEGWNNYSVTWDIKKDNPLELYYRTFSVDEEWEATLRRVVPELPLANRVLRRNGE